MITRDDLILHILEIKDDRKSNDVIEYFATLEHRLKEAEQRGAKAYNEYLNEKHDEYVFDVYLEQFQAQQKSQEGENHE